MSVDYLTEDTVRVPGQNFTCISFLTEEEPAKKDEDATVKTPDRKVTSLTGIKVSGAFATYEEACSHAKRLQNSNPYHNVFVGEMGKWLPYNPNPLSEQAGTPEYAEKELNNLMKAHIENQEKSKLYHEQRKSEMLRKNFLESLQTRQENRASLEQKLTLASNDVERKGLEENIKNIDEQIAKIHRKTAELDKQLENLTEELKKFEPKEVVPPKTVAEYAETTETVAAAAAATD
jgi:Ulp1 family protease